jgi:uncharacterized protein YndB with AHSA1/START domain
MAKSEFKYVTIIAAGIEEVWDGLTLPGFTERYWHHTRVKSDWKEGSTIDFYRDDEEGKEYIGCEGKIIECVRPNRLSYSWRFPRDPETRAEAPSVVAFDLETVGGATKLTVTHDQFEEGSKTFGMITYGWPVVLSNLKTLLETGQPMDHDLF